MTDKTLKCQECGKEFTFTAGEQEFFASKGFTDPKKCKECREAAKNARFSNKNKFNTRRPNDNERAA